MTNALTRSRDRESSGRLHSSCHALDEPAWPLPSFLEGRLCRPNGWLLLEELLEMSVICTNAKAWAGWLTRSLYVTRAGGGRASFLFSQQGPGGGREPVCTLPPLLTAGSSGRWPDPHGDVCLSKEMRIKGNLSAVRLLSCHPQVG